MVELGASLVAQRLKHLPGMRETRVRSLGREDPLEKEMATHSSTLAWRIPWREEPGRLQSMGLQSRTRLSDLICATTRQSKWWVINSGHSDFSVNLIYHEVSPVLSDPLRCCLNPVSPWPEQTTCNVRATGLPWGCGQIKSLDRQRFRPGKQTWETTSYLWNMLEEVQAFHQVKPIPPMEGDG